jgi:hypothetical protein
MEVIEVLTRDIIPDLPQIKRSSGERYKKSAAVLQLEALANLQAKEKKSCPAIAKRIFRDDSANGLTKCIVKYIELRGGFATRINNTGIFNRRLGRFIPSTSKKGLPDIQALINGAFLAIEVKKGKDRQSADQKKIEADINRSGGRYIIASDFQTFKERFDFLFNFENV